MTHELTRIRVGSNSAKWKVRVELDLVAATVSVQRRFEAFEGQGSAPLAPEDLEGARALALELTPAHQARVQQDHFHAFFDEFVEVHRGAEVLRVENPKGALEFSPCGELVALCQRLLNEVVPLPPA